MRVLPTVYVHLRRNRLFIWMRVKNGIISCVILRLRDARVLAHCETRFLCVYASVSVLRKPDRIEFSLASSDLSICLLFSYSHILIFLNVLWDVQQVYYSLCPAGHMFASNLLTTHYRTMFWFESLSKSSLPNICVSFLFVDEYVNRFSSCKKSFRSSSTHCRRWKKCRWRHMTKIIRQRN